MLLSLHNDQALPQTIIHHAGILMARIGLHRGEVPNKDGARVGGAAETQVVWEQPDLDELIPHHPITGEIMLPNSVRFGPEPRVRHRSIEQVAILTGWGAGRKPF